MEWVETTAKTLDEARERALDQLGVGADDAEFDILEEPKPGLFGRMRGEARLRARIRPTQARPKQERRRKPKSDKPADKAGASDTGAAKQSAAATLPQSAAVDASDERPAPAAKRPRSTKKQGDKMSSNDDAPTSTHSDGPAVTPDEVGTAAVAFMDGLTEAFELSGRSELTIDGTELELNVVGEELGLLVGPGGRTLNAVQDLARVAAQRRLGDHETRLRIDVAGYRGRREQALVKFSRQVADQVRTSGVARSLEPMTSADRKVIHDVLNEEDGVASRSVGEDPTRRIIVEPV